MSRILSLQSHVVHGYVGLKSSTFPLQLLGFEVDPVPTVCFSNHTGYASGFKGTKATVAEMRELIEGLKMNNLLSDVGIVLTGYIGRPEYLHGIVEILDAFSSTPDSDVLYVCDPVMGDNGKLYVSPELVSIYRDEVVPKAWLIAPNAFEASTLTSIEIIDKASCHEAIQKLHSMGPTFVAITSVNLGDKMCVVMSEKGGSVWVIETKIVPGHFTGTGDLTTALITAHMMLTENDIKKTLQRTVKTVYSIISETHKHYGGKTGELRIVQCKELIEKFGDGVEEDEDDDDEGRFFTPSPFN